jgi:Putative auto-transporter adhesin, head GIN domain
MRILLFAISALLLSSCHFLMDKVAGNGHIVTRERSAGSFNSVEVSGAFKVHVRQDPGNGVKIETDENLMEYIDVYTQGNTLIIRPKSHYNLDPSQDLIVYVSAPVFRKIDLSGACDVISDGKISGNEPLEIEVSGSGDIQMDVDLAKVSTHMSGNGSINLRGQASDFSADISGSGDVKCYDLVTDNTMLDISGSADAEVTANKKLNIDVSGSSTVHYRGNASVSQNVSGSGTVKKEG